MNGGTKMKIKTINFKFKEDKFWYKLLKKLHLYEGSRWSQDRFNEILDVLEKELAKHKTVSLYATPDVFTILSVMNNRENGPLVVKSPYPDGAGPTNFLSLDSNTLIPLAMDMYCVEADSMASDNVLFIRSCDGNSVCINFVKELFK